MKERYFLLSDKNDQTEKLNDFLKALETRNIEYETDYDSTHFGVCVIVSYESNDVI